MKKIIAIVTIMLALGYSANAQQRNATTAVKQQNVEKVAIQKAAQKDLKALSDFVQLDDNQKQAFLGLFEYKHRDLATPNFSQERKDILAEVMEAKLNATLTADQAEKLSKNTALLQQLTH
ncbi:hypothetical protein [Flavobacterium litorale]|uniref:LTXXQ motif family protein n=1 Tax=Flavobacterium litorale TaxID=2856519 RepID=A0ABX8VCV1_9FLAO|nr:hypothetical protein [Flavobacterium litorale]QYJ68471.1 hypothetical protein K1I41_00895 [Flavobacterium litorale]